VTPRKPSLPIFPKSSCAGKMPASSHSSTCGLISDSMNFFRESCICTWSSVNGMAWSPRESGTSGPGDTELHGAHGVRAAFDAGGQGKGKDRPSVTGVDDAVVEHAGARV